ncbi:uncharacterized protein [Onthophagus taurus]|uniref:uncharacterized protein n=1 Tax=Onthophagus taurus TaxID=166361 RepID=UPI000C203BED|nr:uncharacterized protein LOC111416097 [Onthophagus taurus]
MTLKTITFVVFFVHLITVKVIGCSISINNDLGSPQPLILKSTYDGNEQPFYLPSSGDQITLEVGEIIKIACPGGKISINGSLTNNVEDYAICNKEGKFDIDSKSIFFSSITCSCLPVHTARYTNNTCLNNFTEIEIGFELPLSKQFLRQILVCFDDDKDNTLFTSFNLTKTISGSQVNFPRPSWVQGKFYHVTGVNTLYSRATQRKTINSLLGLASSSYKYVAESGDLYLTRGHLAAKTDFLFGSQHRATFYFINAVPQWQTFNAVNWGRLEANVRDFATNSEKDFVIYTGTYGATTLKHETTGNDVELYLSVKGSDKRIPIPQIIWKIVYEPLNKSAVVMVGVNNPYRTQDDLAKDVICEDVSNRIAWVTWNTTNLKNGYGYCCDYHDFKKIVWNIPELEVNQLLM